LQPNDLKIDVAASVDVEAQIDAQQYRSEQNQGILIEVLSEDGSQHQYTHFLFSIQ